MKMFNKGMSMNVQSKWLLGLGMVLASQLALAGQQVDQSKDTSKRPYVQIEHLNGKAEVVGWDKSEVKVTGELSDQTDEFIFDVDGDSVVIKVEVKRRNNWRYNSDDGDDLKIYVPKGSNVNYTAVNADLDVSDIENEVNAEMVNGDINAHDLTGKVSFEAVNGDIKLRKVKGRVEVETVNGDIRGEHESNEDARFESVNGNIDMRSNSPEVSAETVNGNIELVLQKVNRLDLNTVNGRVEAELELADKGDLEASSVGGSIELNLQKNVSARFDIEAHAGGRIINNITDDEMMKAKYGPRRWLEFVHNGGSARVEVQTVSGRVTLNAK